jgi:tetratricopeptide (TPR) repeat protein
MPGVFSNRERLPNPGMCFVMMPFAENFNAIFRLIQRCCTEQGLTCVRADEDVRPGKITGKIYDLVSCAGVIIADMTGRNPNVFYELGLAHAISDNVILLTQATDDVPFDLKDFIHIRYTNTFDGAEKLATDLSKVLTTILRSADLHVSPDDERRQRQASEIDDLPAEELDLGLLHLQAEIARSGGDMKQAAEWLQKALEAAKDGKGDAPEIGNCAIVAERCRFLDLSEALYAIAIARDPTHVNNRQSYASFLLDHRANNPEKVDLAGQILKELEGTPERQERTRGLLAQYLTIKGKGGGQPIDIDKLIADVVGDGEFSTIEQAAPALLVLQNAGRYNEMRALIEGLREKVPDTNLATLDRILADAFASSGSEQLRDEAVEIYTELLKGSPAQSTDVKHNLATLLFAKDRQDSTGRAFQLWAEAYSDRPSDPSIRKAFAQYLVRQDRKQDAAKVLAGQPIV